MKYNRASYEDSVLCAWRCAEKDGRVRYVWPTNEGFRISTAKPCFPSAHQMFAIVGAGGMSVYEGAEKVREWRFILSPERAALARLALGN